jgi:hypothetical protein
MTALLTWNGIPPQIIGSLTEDQQQALVRYAYDDRNINYPDWRSNDSIPPALRPFAKTVAAVASSFTCWGASVSNVREWNKIGLNSTHVKTGDATYPGDFNLHSDEANALPSLHNDRFLVLRLLCVSSSPADFIDLTEHENMRSILDEHRIDNSRVYKPEMLTLAQTRGQVVNPKPWDIIVFDAATPHNPKGALLPHQRILQDAWIDVCLPPDWQARIKSGDAPKLQFV